MSLLNAWSTGTTSRSPPTHIHICAVPCEIGTSWEAGSERVVSPTLSAHIGSHSLPPTIPVHLSPFAEVGKVVFNPSKMAFGQSNFGEQ